MGTFLVLEVKRLMHMVHFVLLRAKAYIFICAIYICLLCFVRTTNEKGHFYSLIIDIKLPNGYTMEQQA